MRSCRAFAVALVIAFGSSLVAACSGGTSNPVTPAPHGLQSIRHVFVITLENESYNTTFGANSPAPYLSQTLAGQGALLTQYYGTGHVSLDNYIAMLSGQPSSTQTRVDCGTYQDFAMTGTSSDGLAIGTGCVYPATVKALPDQLTAAGFTWKAYMEDMGNDPSREAAACGHPTLNTADLTQSPEAPSAGVPLGDQYATRHDPFMYFHSIIDSSNCTKDVVPLPALTSDLGSVATTANFTFITPNLCDDGHDAPCVTGQPGGLVSANTFLQKWVPLITQSPAYQQDGLLIINFDESAPASQTGTASTVTITFAGTTCCNQQPGPNVTYPASLPLGTLGGVTYSEVLAAPGGDNTGAVLLSKFIRAGTVSNTPYNHYSLLRTIEDIFVPGTYLGYAGASGLRSMGSDVFASL
jgi:phosphatidylinositol-3-phosphatase